MKTKTTIYELNIYLHKRLRKFCSIEFTTIEKARSYMSTIALAEKVVTFDDISFNVADFKYAIIKKVKR